MNKMRKKKNDASVIKLLQLETTNVQFSFNQIFPSIFSLFILINANYSHSLIRDKERERKKKSSIFYSNFSRFYRTERTKIPTSLYYFSVL